MPKYIIKNITILALFAILGSTLAHGQSGVGEETQGPPTGPLLRDAPDFSSWTEIYAYSLPVDENNSLQKKQYLSMVKAIEIIKTKNIIYQTIVYNSGNKTEKWQVEGNVFLKPQNQTYWSVYGAGYNPDMVAYIPELLNIAESGAKDLMFKKFEGIRNFETTPLPNTGFTGLEWVSASTYVGKYKSKDMEWLLFVPYSLKSTGPKKPEEIRAQPTYAIIDASTRFPIEDRKDGVTRTYQFLTAPTAQLTLPADLIKEVKEGREKLQKAFAMPPRGY